MRKTGLKRANFNAKWILSKGKSAGRILLIAMLVIGLVGLSGCRRKGKRPPKKLTQAQIEDQLFYCLYPDKCKKRNQRR